MKFTLPLFALLLSILTSLQAHAAPCHYLPTQSVLDKEVLGTISLAIEASAKLTSKDDGTVYVRDLATIRKHDKRKVKTSKDSHLDAVGRLIIKFDDNTVGTCSSGLVAKTPGRGSDIITSAEHCFKNREGKWQPRVKSISWVSNLANGDTVERVAKVISTSSESDIALLRLNKPIDFKTIKPYLFQADAYIYADEMFYYTSEAYIAGYSSDVIQGDSGKKLTYTRLNANQSAFKQDGSFGYVTATSFQGSSGGVFVARADLSEEDIENPYNQLYFVGTTIRVISLDREKPMYYLSGESKGSNETVFAPYEKYILELGADVRLEDY